MLFVDSAKLDDLRQAARLPFVGGASCNPSLLAAALGRDRVDVESFSRHVQAMAEALVGQLFIQTLAADEEGILRDAALLCKLVPLERLVVKIPYHAGGLRAAARLEADGVRTCITSIHSVLQAYASAASGASWIAPYCNRITRAGGDGVAEVGAMIELLARQQLACRLLVASVKSLDEMRGVLAHGAQVVTVPLELLTEVARHAASEAALEQFNRDLRWA
jgi:TalC/MipB family fructose-6-phosphate aldolase